MFIAVNPFIESLSSGKEKINIQPANLSYFKSQSRPALLRIKKLTAELTNTAPSVSTIDVRLFEVIHSIY